MINIYVGNIFNNVASIYKNNNTHFYNSNNDNFMNCTLVPGL